MEAKLETAELVLGSKRVRYREQLGTLLRIRGMLDGALHGVEHAIGAIDFPLQPQKAATSPLKLNAMGRPQQRRGTSKLQGGPTQGGTAQGAKVRVGASAAEGTSGDATDGYSAAAAAVRGAATSTAV